MSTPSAESEEQQILKELADHVPWNEITKRHRVSAKTIAKIAKSKKSQADTDTAVKVFNLLITGMTPDRIVTRINVHPNAVSELVGQYELLKSYNPRLVEESYKHGYRAGCRDCAIVHPCKFCGKEIAWDLSQGNDRKQIMGILEQGGISDWYHTKCKPESGEES